MAHRYAGEAELHIPSPVCFNVHMASHQHTTAPGRYDLEPFWPSRQENQFDMECCRAFRRAGRS